MRYILVILAIMISWISLWSHQHTVQAQGVPTSISQHCLITQSGTIDFCPQYWTQVRELNITLHQARWHHNAQWSSVLLNYLISQIAQFNSEAYVTKISDSDGYQRFILEYERYITQMVYDFLSTNPEATLQDFWKTTYFDAYQWGLAIQEVKLYAQQSERYDKTINLQISVRNFTPNQISQIEDIYCFATVNGQDYIYPLNTRTILKANTITNMIIPLKVWTTPLTEQIGTKNVACVIVYAQFNVLQYSNRSTLSFDVQ